MLVDCSNHKHSSHGSPHELYQQVDFKVSLHYQRGEAGVTLTVSGVKLQYCPHHCQVQRYPTHHLLCGQVG